MTTISTLSLTYNAPGNKLTWFKSGGLIKNMYHAHNLEEVQTFLEKNRHHQYHIFGNSTNTLLSDDGIEIGLKLKLCGVRIINPYEHLIEVEAGLQTTQLTRFCIQNQIGGLEFTSTVPGTLGGLIFMNAGAYGGEMKDVVKTVTILTSTGQLVTLNNSEINYSYRKSNFPKGSIIISAVLQGKYAHSQTIKDICQEMQEKRKSTQPLDIRTLGSTFMNPSGAHAGILVQDSGLKGTICGGARISNKHGNFIENFNHATSSDFLKLANLMKKTVLEKYNIDLHMEVKLIGSFQS